jgi:rod shape-determining protein MreD
MMTVLIYSGLVLLLIPVQTTLLPHATVWEIKPDAGLVAACFVGLLAGELRGVVVGLVIGWALNLFSAGELWVSLVTKGGAGFCAGMMGRHLTHVSPTLMGIGVFTVSCLSGLVHLFTLTSLSESWGYVSSVILPQACYDALVAAGLYWIFSEWFVKERFAVAHRY